MKARLIPILFALLAPIVPLMLVLSSQAWFGAVSDLPEFYVASRMMLEGQGASIYKLDSLGQSQHMLYPIMGERIVGLYIPPFAVPWLLPLGLFKADTVPIAWMALQLVFVIVSVLVLGKIFSLSFKGVLWLWAVLSISGPFYEALRIGQLAPLLLLGFSLSLWAFRHNRQFLGSVALSVLLLKPQELAPFLVYLLGARRYSVMGYFVLGAAILCGISMILVGVDGYKNYLDLLASSVENTGGMQPELAATVRGQLLRFFPEQKVLVTQVSMAVLLFAWALIFYLGHRQARTGKWLEAGLIAAVPLGLVTSLHCHDYDLLLLVPSFLSIMKGGLVTKFPDWLVLASILCLPLFLLPLYVVIHYQYLLSGGVINPLFILLAGFCGAGLALMHSRSH